MKRIMNRVGRKIDGVLERVYFGIEKHLWDESEHREMIMKKLEQTEIELERMKENKDFLEDENYWLKHRNELRNEYRRGEIR